MTPTTDQTKLADCPNPWCDGAPEVLGFGVAYFGVKCRKCGLEGPRHGEREVAIAAWNTRPHPTAAHGLADWSAEDLLARWSICEHGAQPLECPKCGNMARDRLLVTLRSSQPDTREGFAAGIEAAAKCADAQVRRLRSVGLDGNNSAYLASEIRKLRPTAAPSVDALVEARAALQAMMDAWLDYHDAHSLTQPVTGAAGNAFDKALAARDKIDTELAAKETTDG